MNSRFTNGKIIVLDIELSGPRNFLDHVIKEAGQEMEEIDAKNEEGNFETLDDYQNALYFPFSRYDMAIRAVFYETTALVEHELQKLSHKAWVTQNKSKTPKYMAWYEFDKPDNYLKQLSFQRKTYWDFLQFRRYYLVKLIEDHYKIKISKLPGYQHLEIVRKIVNAFKHRKGLKDFSKSRNIKMGECYRPALEAAYDAIEQARVFIIALWEATGQLPKRKKR